MSGWYFTVLGDAAPQGSKKGFLAHGHVVVKEQSSEKIKTWRGDIQQAVRALDAPKLDGPVAMHIVFTMRRPASSKKSEFAPYRTPDSDKLLRGLLDPITQCGLLADDARVSHLTRLAKVWPGDYDALPEPGVLVAAIEMTSLPTLTNDSAWELQLRALVMAARPQRKGTEQCRVASVENEQQPLRLV